MPSTFLLQPPRVITPWSLESIGAKLYGMGAGNMTGVGSTAYPSANLAIYIPFTIAKPIVVVKLFSYNGATVSGNIDMGIYTADGTRLVSIGSTAQATTSNVQEFDISDTLLNAGLYYLAVAKNDTTGTLFAVASGSAVAALATMGIAQQASAFPLPATATFATASQDYTPLIGLTTGVTI